MGAGFVILLWLIIAAAYLGVAAIFCGLFLLGLFKKWRWLRWTAGVPFAGMLVLGAIVVAALVIGSLVSLHPRQVFKNTFHELPSREISELRSSLYWFADTGSVFLRFRTTEAEFRRLVPGRLAPRTSEQMRVDIPVESGFDPPLWWDYRLDPRWLYQMRSESRSADQGPAARGFYSEAEYFAFDPETRTAYYRFVGID